MKKVKITFVVPENLQNELRTAVIKAGYGLRGKSRWVSEAIEALLVTNNYPELVNINEIMHGFEKVETIVIDYSLKVKLDKAIIEIRQSYPILEGVQSNLVRTAILQKLLRTS